MSIFEEVVNTTRDNVSRMVLTNPDIASGIVGLQPLVSMQTGEAAVVYQAYKRAGIDFQQDFSFLEFGKERNFAKIMMNNRAAENVLRTYQKELGISVPDRRMSNSEVLAHSVQLLNDSDPKRTHLAMGLFSGFPLEDCQSWLQSANAQPIPQIKQITDPDSRFFQAQAKPTSGSDKVFKLDPISLLNPDDYKMSSSRNHYLPDTRSKSSQGATRGIIEGFGVRWSAPLPPREGTIRHAQKLLQVDREIGLLDFVNRQRSTFNVAQNRRVITMQRNIRPPGIWGALMALGELGHAFRQPKPREEDRAA